MEKESVNDGKAVLFVLIGWAIKYDGTESIVGNHRYLQDHPEDNSEAQAFVPRDDEYHYCGVGRGGLHETTLDVAFIARHEESGTYRVAGVYEEAEVIPGDYWTTIRTKTAYLYPAGSRPTLETWPIGQGVRRWAHRLEGRGREHAELYAIYKKLRKPSLKQIEPEVALDPELSAFEGKKRKAFIVHRTREEKLRSAKIREAISKGRGHIKCEVPGCGFDFYERYGEVGHRFAVVHHLAPLSESEASGRKNTLEDLAVVCANCHAMIHRGGECRQLSTLIPKHLGERQ